MYKNLILYCFSGTGNSSAVCEWAAGAAKRSGLNVFVQSLDGIKTPKIPDAAGKSLIGFIYPTHGFLPIWPMLKFIFRFPRSSMSDIFLATTVGGSRIGSIMVHGLAGGGLYIPALILKCKRYSIRGLIDVDLPSSWTAVHPPFGPLTTAEWIMVSRPQVEAFTAALLSGRRQYELDFPLLDLLVIPISPVYLIGGKIFSAKILFASYKCKGCKTCAANCPVSAIEMKKRRPYWTWRCVHCNRCINICPQTAIQSNIFYIVFKFWLTTLYPLIVLFPIVRPVFVGRFGSLPGEVLLWSVYYALYMLTIVLVYRLYSYLLRLKPVNYLFTVTSITRYYGRYMMPG